MSELVELGADLVLFNGKVVTVDKVGSEAEAVAVKDGMIIKVGTSREVLQFARGDTVRIDLEGKLLLPGFIDTHEHCIRKGLQLDWVNCRTPPMNSLEDVMKALREKAESKPPGEWVIGSWFDESQWGDKRFPNRYDLDRASTSHPIYLGRAGGHNSVANSLALEMAGISKDTPQPPGGNIERDENGEPYLVYRCNSWADVVWEIRRKGDLKKVARGERPFMTEETNEIWEKGRAGHIKKLGMIDYRYNK